MPFRTLLVKRSGLLNIRIPLRIIRHRKGIECLSGLLIILRLTLGLLRELTLGLLSELCLRLLRELSLGLLRELSLRLLSELCPGIYLLRKLLIIAVHLFS
jgi:hypothetical protein